MTVTTSGAATDIAEGVNTVWLDSIIAQGQTVLVRAGGAITQREIAYLLAAGYTQQGNLLIPPP